ncbi:aTPase AAA-2 domain protein [Clostridium sp. CAG:448]|nr:aTPase AAA-2 domain protein [Clostridium sp. CAG:448]
MTYGTDLCAAAKAGKLDPVIGRDTETERMIRILSRRQKNNPCLIGEPGVGKTAIAEGLAIRIANGNVPDSLLEKRIVTLDIAGMVAGAKYRGEFEERFKNVIKEATADPDLILFIDEIHNLIGAGAAEGAVDAANIIKPALARSDIRVIGATTVTEYRKYIEKDAALERRFQSIPVGEPSEEDAIRILQGLRPKYEAHHHLHIPDETIRAAVHLSVRYLPDRFLPDKAIDLIDEAASRIRICADSIPPDLQQTQDELAALRREKEAAINAQNFAAAASLHEKETELLAKEAERRTAYTRERDENPLQVRPEDISLVISQWTGIPVTKPEEDTAKKLLGLEAALQKRIIGQDRAIDAVCRAVRRGRTGLKNPHRPVASFLFLGSTGVGKTELSRALASVLFGNENAMIRFDMSEYMERHSVSKLIGSPPGYVGYEEGGQLTEKIRRHPYSVLLFDEIEKAHPDVFNLLLQVLEDGRLTDSQGRTVSFADAVVIMTSNLGSSDLNPQQAVDPPTSTRSGRSALRKTAPLPTSRAKRKSCRQCGQLSARNFSTGLMKSFCSRRSARRS